MKVQSWSIDEWKHNLRRRLMQAKRYRHQFERIWRENEKILFTDIGQYPDQIVVTEENLLRFDTGESEVGQDQIGMNYAWKYLRFVHSQMSANPPSVVVRPASTEYQDRKKADAADRIVRHLRRALDMQEIFDQANLNALTYGNGYIKTVWDPLRGEPVDFNEASREILMEGALDAYSVDPWNMWLDPNARTWGGIRWTIERHEIPVDHAHSMWPEQKEALDRYVRVKDMEKSEVKEDASFEEIIEVYEYYEKAQPINGMAGRHVFHLEDGTILGAPDNNPHPNAGLPYNIMGDSDVPGNIYNKAFVEYLTKMQDFLNRFDSTVLDNIEAHLVVRMVLPEGAEIEEDAISNSGWDYTKMTGAGGNAPHFISPPSLMPDAWRFREAVLQGMQEMAGVNDSMLGVQKREISGFSMQTAIDAGNTVRRRLFNKYTAFVECTYKNCLELVKEHWTDPQVVQVLGVERAFESRSFKGADIKNGYDVVSEYGASLSLDPARRREEIQQLKPDLMEAGMSPRAIVQMYRLNELDGIYDRMAVAALRQSELFDEMIETGEYLEPEELMDHQGMLEFAYEYRMSAEFKYLDDNSKENIEKHIKAREQLAAQAATQGQAPGAAAGAAPAGPEGVPPGAPPELAAVEGGG